MTKRMNKAMTEMVSVLPDVVDGIHQSLCEIAGPGLRVSAYDAMERLGADCDTMSSVIALLKVHNRAQYDGSVITLTPLPAAVTAEDLMMLDEEQKREAA